jgi:hypothetical protein
MSSSMTDILKQLGELNSVKYDVPGQGQGVKGQGQILNWLFMPLALAVHKMPGILKSRRGLHGMKTDDPGQGQEVKGQVLILKMFAIFSSSIGSSNWIVLKQGRFIKAVDRISVRRMMTQVKTKGSTVKYSKFVIFTASIGSSNQNIFKSDIYIEAMEG